MSLTQTLSLVILVSFVVTVVLALLSYGVYKLRERRRPRPVSPAEAAPQWFERVPAPEDRSAA